MKWQLGHGQSEFPANPQQRFQSESQSRLNWHQNRHHVETLERIFHRTATPKRNWNTRLKGLWERAIAALDVSDEPRVWRSQDGHGDVLWNAYDPKTGKSVNCVSEADLRVWLEARYSQTPSSSLSNLTV
ncbi:hypothetical protein HNI00_12095 [Thermoleptolyngbya oregonensis NK1-22]|uniref:Uncharacterized protein n=1 Tax=Thermoleptolyngbya oregonensis NK1-22 TaxID=2547457 RepID=A0AA96Y5C7_9CYAN|nr:hypothetical protein [Thermoleptolyngbya oregonensis]WOB43814.1 hypothetical protein HNI00_12095 [Thermoleptolyngbya oregonensis NK1-22]